MINSPSLTSPYAIKTVLLLSICISSVFCADYHFDKSVKLNTSNPIVKATAVKDDTLAVQSSHSSQSVVTLLQGSTFEKKTLEFTSVADQSQIKATTNGIFINDGASLLQKKINRLNLTYAQNKSFGVFSNGSNMISNSQYSLTGKFDLECPALRLVNLTNLTVEDLFYDSVDHWKAFAATILADVHNGDIIFAKGYQVYILNNQTFEIYETIDSAQYGEDIVEQISTYYNQTTNQALLLVGRYRDNYDTLLYSVWWKNHTTQEYDDVSSFYLPKELKGPIFANNTNTSISISGYQINYWSNVYSVLNQNYIDDDVVVGVTPLVVSYGETLFLARNDTGYFAVYTIDPEYQVAQNATFPITTSPVLKSKITSDDAFFFLSTQNNTVYKVNISSQTFVTVNDIGVNNTYLDFHLFNSGIDRLVTAVLQNGSYYLQLRSISSLALISQVQYSTNETNLTMNLVGNIEWSTFALSIQSSNAITVQTYSIAGNIITLVNTSQQAFGSTIYACSNYLLIRQNGSTALKVYNLTDLSLITTITITEFSSFSVETQRNIFIISDNVGSKRTIYDLDVSFQPKGSFFVNKNAASNFYNFIIFPKKGLYYQTAKVLQSFQPVQIFYNIDAPLFNTFSTIQITNKTKDEAVYYQDQTNIVNGSQCNSIFYVQYDFSNAIGKYNPQLVRYIECNKTLEKYPIQTYQAVSLSKVFFSSDKRYVIVGVKFSQNNYFLVELRSISNLSTIIIRQNITTANYAYTLNTFNVDVTLDNKLIIQTPFTITILDLESQRFSENYGVASIITFDVSNNGLTALVGVSLSNASQTTIVVKNQTSGQIIFNQNVTNITVQSIAISPLGTLIAFFTNDSNINVWSVTNQTAILSSLFIGATSIKFIDQTKLLIQFSTNYSILPINSTLNNSKSISDGQRLLQVNSYSVSVSNDGSLIAVASNNIITIYENNGNQVATYAAPLAANQSIVSTSFSPSNNLVVSTNNGAIYVLAASSCLPGTILGDNLNCIDCQFPCKYCSGSTTSCTQYQASFFVLVILGPILLIATIIVIVVFIRKRRIQQTKDEQSSNLTKNNTYPAEQQKTEKHMKKPLKDDY